MLSKQEAIDQSISSIFKMLYSVLENPALYHDREDIKAALKSQGALCSMRIEISLDGQEFVVSPISLNTLKKRLGDPQSDRDFAFLDRLRSSAALAIKKSSEQPSRDQKRSLSALDRKVKELEDSVSALSAVNMVLIQALSVNRKDLIAILDTPNTGLRQRRIQQAIDRVVKIISINPPPFNDVSLPSVRPNLHLVSNEKKTD